MHVKGAKKLAPVLEATLARIDLISMEPEVLARANEPFPTPVRTLDSLHLATFSYALTLQSDLKLATFDHQMAKAAQALGFVTV